MKLNFEQRQEAVQLEAWVIDNPDAAAAEIVGLRAEAAMSTETVKQIIAALSASPPTAEPRAIHTCVIHANDGVNGWALDVFLDPTRPTRVGGSWSEDDAESVRCLVKAMADARSGT